MPWCIMLKHMHSCMLMFTYVELKSACVPAETMGVHVYLKTANVTDWEFEWPTARTVGLILKMYSIKRTITFRFFLLFGCFSSCSFGTCFVRHLE